MLERLWWMSAFVSSLAMGESLKIPIGDVTGGKERALHTNLFLVRYFLPPETSIEVRSGMAELPVTSVPEDLKPFFLDLSQKKNYLEVMKAFLEALKQGKYNEHRSIHYPWLPDTREKLEGLLGYRQARFLSFVKKLSLVKGMSRAVYELGAQPDEKFPNGLQPEISIAETLETVEGDLKAKVRETEVIVARDGDSKDYDFYVYGEDGKLTTQSKFSSATGREYVANTPFRCLTCHYSPSTQTFDLTPLAGDSTN